MGRFVAKAAIFLLVTVAVALRATADDAEGGDTVGIHAPFDSLLKQFAHPTGVDYTGFAKHIDELDAYLDALAKTVPAEMDRAHKLALYINAYNACTVRLILRHYPDIKSIKNLENPWGTREWTIGGETLSLDQIEHRKLRGQLGEPRIHFALNCASISSPPLRPSAFTVDNIDRQLERATREFLRDTVELTEKEEPGERKNYVLRVSRIFKWFNNDFTPSVPEFVAPHVDPQTAETLRRNIKRIDITYQNYDWGLNDYLK